MPMRPISFRMAAPFLVVNFGGAYPLAGSRNPRSVAPVEVARSTPERILSGFHAFVTRAGKAGLLHPGGAVGGVLDPRLFLGLEERMVLEWILDPVAVDRHVALELGVLALQLEVILDHACK